MNDFFERYSNICRENGMSPNGAAKEMGLPSSSITNWKQGKAPRAESLLKIADYFSVSVDWLLGNSDEKKKPTTENGDGLDAKRRRALNLIEAMNDEQLDALLKLLGR